MYLWCFVLAALLPIVLVWAEKCGVEKYECAGEFSSCKDNKCTCNDLYEGFPLLGCQRKGNFLCQMYSDPFGTTFGGEHTSKVSLPCRFLMADFTTKTTLDLDEEEEDDIGDDQNAQLECKMKLYGAQRRVGGRMSLYGYDIAVEWTKVTQGGEQSSGVMSLRMFGTEINGSYSYKYETRDGLSGPYIRSNDLTKLRDGVRGTVNRFYYTSDRFVHLLVGNCGFRVRFRPANREDTSNSPAMPGLALTVYNRSFETTFNNPEYSFCLSPDTQEVSVAQLKAETQMSASALFTLTALAGQADQNFPDVSVDECSKAGELVGGMLSDPSQYSTLGIAETKCRFILTSAPFVSCYASGRDSGNLMALYRNCLDGYFNGDAVLCASQRSLVEEAGCLGEAAHGFCLPAGS